MKALKFLKFLLLGLLISCSKTPEFREELAHSELHQKFLSSLNGALPHLKKPNLNQLMGRSPSAKELELGRLLFNDPVLSRNNDVSCASCHLSNHGFADGNSLTVGSGGLGGPNGNNVGSSFGKGVLSLNRSLGHFSHGHHATDFMFRNSLSTLNVSLRVDQSRGVGLFWDGRFGDLLFQVLLPIHTPQEMCGTNPIVLNDKGENIFRKKGPIFNKGITINHTNSFDEFSGRDTGLFNSQPVVVSGIPYRRKNGQISIPNRNECLALTIAKLRRSSEYRSFFKDVYGDLGLTDKTLAMALQAFVFTHVAIDSPYDKFLKGEVSLSKKELMGMAQFLTPANKVIKVAGEEVKGAGCISCHDKGTFGGSKFSTIGVRSDFRSSLSRGENVQNNKSGFFARERGQRGLSPQCHIEGVTVASSGHAPDIGHATVSLKKEDCFKMRVPPLRNVIETFPYYHHGTGNLRGLEESNLEKKALMSLERVIRYHLRGITNYKRLNREKPLKPFVDEFQQFDFLIPYYQMQDESNFGLKKVDYTSEQIENLVHFIAYGLWDRQAVKKGLLGNDLSHPKRVPSGLSPTITRDHGTQLDYQ